MDKELSEGIAAMEQEDYVAAYRILMPLAEQGVSEAQYRIGSMYHRAEGVFRDFKEAGIWYRKAADQGHADAYMSLGHLYSVGEKYGNNLPHDPTEAMRCYHKAADLGSTFALIWLAGQFERGNGVKRDHDKAAYWYRKAADQGSVNALLSLGFLYAHYEVKEYTRALACYREAIDKGEISAWYHIGFMYLWGQGVEKNAAEAIRCWRKLADRGDCCAQALIGDIYAAGKDLPKDLVGAYKWFSLAIAAGEQGQCKTHNFLYVNFPVPEKLDDGMGKHHKSEHTPREQAHEECCIDREKIAAFMTPEQIKSAQRLVDEWRPIESRH